MFLITYVLDGENNVCIAFIWSKKLKLYLKNKMSKLDSQKKQLRKQKNK